jgi:hypothetical protein
MPQSWNRYPYCLNNPLMYVDPDGLTWYKKKGSNQPEWFDENPGNDYEEIRQHVYWGGDEHGWVALNPLKNEFRTGFATQNAAIQYNDHGQEVSLADGISEMSMFTGLGGLARGVLNIGARLGARFFAREAAETATETLRVGCHGKASPLKENSSLSIWTTRRRQRERQVKVAHKCSMICQHLAVLNLRFLVAVHSLAPVVGLPDMDFDLINRSEPA